MTIPSPTHDQCDRNERVTLPDGRVGTAAWYPSMGGYVSHCLIVTEADSGCVEVLVWHDGDFPFSENYLGVPENPRELHHCNAASFIGFGELVQRIQDDQDD